MAAMLYVFASPNCELCREAEPHVAALAAETRGTPPIIRLNPNLMDWNIAGFEPRMTPSYALVRRGELLGAVEGELLTHEQLKEFLASPDSFSRARKVARKAAEDADE